VERVAQCNIILGSGLINPLYRASKGTPGDAKCITEILEGQKLGGQNLVDVYV